MPQEEKVPEGAAGKTYARMIEEGNRIREVEERSPHLLNAYDELQRARRDPSLFPILSFSGHEADALFHGRGDGTFESIGEVSGAGRREDGRGAALADFDGDGDVDIALHNLLENPLVLLRNDVGSEKASMTVRLRGVKSNRFGVGARVTVTAGGRKQVKDVVAGNGFLSCSPPEVSFGLGDASGVVAIDVRWPSGVKQHVDSVDVRRIVTITEEGDQKAFLMPFKPSVPAGFEKTPRVPRPGDAWTGPAGSTLVFFSDRCHLCQEELKRFGKREGLTWVSIDTPGSAALVGPAGARLPLVYRIKDGVVAAKFMGEGAIELALKSSTR